jgi:ATP-dependent DNA helicase RecG
MGFTPLEGLVMATRSGSVDPGLVLWLLEHEGVDVAGAVLDEQEIKTNVVNLVARLEAVLKGHLHTRLVSVGGFREEPRPTYPLAALREACLNAIMHRNYESSHAPVL